MQRGDPIKLNFEDIEMQKWNKPTDRAQIVDEINVLLSNYVYSWSYDHKNVINGSFFILSADDSNKTVTIWEKY